MQAVAVLGGIQWVGRPKAASEGVEEVVPLAWGLHQD